MELYILNDMMLYQIHGMGLQHCILLTILLRGMSLISGILISNYRTQHQCSFDKVCFQLVKVSEKTTTKQNKQTEVFPLGLAKSLLKFPFVHSSLFFHPEKIVFIF